jgi:hypothetical protein
MNDGPRTFPQYINEDKSDMLGIKSGWHAIDEGGNLVFGPFDTTTNASRETFGQRISSKAGRPEHGL